MRFSIRIPFSIALGFLYLSGAVMGGNDNPVFSREQIFPVLVDVSPGREELLRQSPRIGVPAHVHFGDQVFSNAAVALRGHSTFEPIDKQPNLAIRFDRAEVATWFGLSKVLLHSPAKDPGLMRELLAGELYRAAKVPAPKVGHGRVYLNGRDLGLYCIVETVNKSFLENHFGNHNGNLYEGNSRDINESLELDNGQANNEIEIKGLLDAALQTDPNTRWKKLNARLDVDEFLSFVAIEMFAGNWDGYTVNHNNYRIYHNPETGRLSFIPHGMDSAFSTEEVRLMPPTRQILLKALLRTPEGRAAYWTRAGILFSNVFQPQSLLKRVSELSMHLQTASTNSIERTAIAAHASAISDWIERAHRTLQEQINRGQARRAEFDNQGNAPLNHWRPVGGLASAQLADQLLEGRQVLRISRTNGVCVASWRTRVLLEPGKYRLAGKARVKGVEPHGGVGNAGAWLYLDSEIPRMNLLKDCDWSELAFDFEVADGGAEIEPVCEFRGIGGEAWFDADSLKLTKRK